MTSKIPAMEALPRRMGPKKPDHPSIGTECPACHVSFVEGDCTALVMLGPGDDPEMQRRSREGRPYTGVALELHYGCATGFD